MSRADWLAEKRAEIATLADLPLPRSCPAGATSRSSSRRRSRASRSCRACSAAIPPAGRAWPELDVVEFARACDDADAGGVGGAAPRRCSAARWPTSTRSLRRSARRCCATISACTDSDLSVPLCTAPTPCLLPRLPTSMRPRCASWSPLASSMHMASVIEVGDDGRARAPRWRCPPPASDSPGRRRRPRRSSARLRACRTSMPRHRTVLLLDEVAAARRLVAAGWTRSTRRCVGDALLDADDPGRGDSGVPCASGLSRPDRALVCSARGARMQPPHVGTLLRRLHRRRGDQALARPHRSATSTTPGSHC